MTIFLLYQCAVDYICTYNQINTEKQCLNLSSESSSVKQLSGFSSMYFVTDKETSQTQIQNACLVAAWKEQDQDNPWLS